MFNIGDSIVYPNQGVGIIELIEQMEFQGEMQSYYKISLLNNSMKLTLPSSRAEVTNLRLVSDYETIVDSLNNIERYTTDDKEINNSDYKARMNMNALKMKSGTLDDFLEVICNLTQINNQKKLNINEKRILDTTTNMLIQEIVQSKDLSVKEATDLLNNAIKF